MLSGRFGVGESAPDGFGGGWSEEFVGVAGVAVATAEFAAPVGVDGPCHPVQAFGDGLVQDGANGERAEVDVVACVEVFALLGHAAQAVDSGLGEDGKEGFRIRHLFAFPVVRLGFV